MAKRPRLEFHPGPKGFGWLKMFSPDRRRYQWVAYNLILWDEDRRFRANILRLARRGLWKLLHPEW